MFVLTSNNLKKMKKLSLISSAVVITAMMVTSCGGGASNEVTIGKQVWMNENLNVDKFRNGDPIPEAKTDEEWERASNDKQPAWCYYDNDPANGSKYGRLYNWYAVNDSRGLAPKDWHVPSDAEWTQLTVHLGGEEVAGGKMKSTTEWNAPNKDASNSSGFSGLPGGTRTNGPFGSVGERCYCWSSTENSANNAWVRYLYYYDGSVDRTNYVKGRGLSVRCIRD